MRIRVSSVIIGIYIEALVYGSPHVDMQGYGNACG